MIMVGGFDDKFSGCCYILPSGLVWLVTRCSTHFRVVALEKGGNTYLIQAAPL